MVVQLQRMHFDSSGQPVPPICSGLSSAVLYLWVGKASPGVFLDGRPTET
jgi:hypothetical protein